METIMNTNITVTLFDRQNPELQTLFFSVVSTISISGSDEQEPACQACKYLHQWRQTTIALVTAEPHHSPLTVLTSSLVSIHTEKMSMNVSGCNIFLMEVFNSTPLLNMSFHFRHCFVRLPLCCHL